MPIEKNFVGRSGRDFRFVVKTGNLEGGTYVCLYRNSSYRASQYFYLNGNGQWVGLHVSAGWIFSNEAEALKALINCKESNEIINDIVENKLGRRVSVDYPVKQKLRIFLSLLGFCKLPLDKIVFGPWGRVYRG